MDEFETRRRDYLEKLKAVRNLGLSFSVSLKDKNLSGDQFEFVSVCNHLNSIIVAPFHSSYYMPWIRDKLELIVHLPAEVAGMKINRIPNTTIITYGNNGAKSRYEFFHRLPRIDTDEGFSLFKKMVNSLYLFDVSEITNERPEIKYYLAEREAIMEIPMNNKRERPRLYRKSY